MTTSKRTSRVFDVWDALYDLLDSKGWPAHPVTLAAPPVFYGDMNEDRVEAVVVVGVPTDSPSIDQATFGASQSREEEFTLRVMVGTKVQGRTGREARDRLAELCDVVQEALRSPSSGRQAGGFSQSVPGVQWWRISRMAPQIYAMAEGYAGYAELDVVFHTYI